MCRNSTAAQRPASTTGRFPVETNGCFLRASPSDRSPGSDRARGSGAPPLPPGPEADLQGRVGTQVLGAGGRVPTIPTRGCFLPRGGRSELARPRPESGATEPRQAQGAGRRSRCERNSILEAETAGARGSTMKKKMVVFCGFITGLFCFFCRSS